MHKKLAILSMLVLLFASKLYLSEQNSNEKSLIIYKDWNLRQLLEDIQKRIENEEKKSMIITGPNSSGKTIMTKSRGCHTECCGFGYKNFNEEFSKNFRRNELQKKIRPSQQNIRIVDGPLESEKRRNEMLLKVEEKR